MATFEDVGRELELMGEIYGRTISQGAAIMMARDLSECSPSAVMKALQSCRRELIRFPTVADIISRVQASDGRPGAEEAWSKIPKDDYGSCVWTIEMATAYAAAHPHVKVRDFVAARMAFKEVYERELKAARETGVPVVWSASLGEDKAGRDAALSEAVRKNQMTLEQAQRISPMLDEQAKGSPKLLGIIRELIKEIPEAP